MRVAQFTQGWANEWISSAWFEIDANSVRRIATCIEDVVRISAVEQCASQRWRRAGRGSSRDWQAIATQINDELRGPGGQTTRGRRSMRPALVEPKGPDEA